MNILDQIIEHKRKEVSERKELYPIKFLEQSIFFGTQPVSLKKYIQREDKSGIIAEIKRKSPSKGIINPHVSVERTSIGYMQAGASALSVLTDKNFFGGSNEDLTTARKYNFCPILRKDFTIEEYQIVEAKSIGADAILLIAAVLDASRLKALASFAHTFGLEVLLEVHNEEELETKLGCRCRFDWREQPRLKNFSVEYRSFKATGQTDTLLVVKVSESGIESVQAILGIENVWL